MPGTERRIAGVLLLRGLSREQRHWGRFPSLLAERMPDARVHALDLPGTGTEHARTSPPRIAGIVEDLRARWLPLRAGAPGPWALVGISLGGMVSLGWCAAHPDDFAALVVGNTSAADLSPPWERMDLAVVPEVLRALVERDRLARERRVLAITTRLLGAAEVDATAAAFAALQVDRPVRRSAVVRQLVAALRFRSPSSLRVPARVLSGARDPFTSPACSRKLAAHLGADIAVHPGAGHDLALDDPAWVADEVARFAAEVAAR